MNRINSKNNQAWNVILHELFDKYATQLGPRTEAKTPDSIFTIDEWTFEQFNVSETLWQCKITNAARRGTLRWWQHGSFATELLSLHGAAPAELAKAEKRGNSSLPESISAVVIIKVPNQAHWLYL